MIIKPAGRTLKEFGQLKPAEQKLLDACRQGEFANISDKRPKAASDENTVRAAFLRFLALGGDEKAPVYEKGVQLVGAWIEGELDMKASRICTNFTVESCYFNGILTFRDARIAGTLNLSDCQITDLEGGMLACDGSLFLRRGFTATGEVRLLGAQIGGDLDCSMAKFGGKNGDALSAERAVIKGSVFLNEGFTATRNVQFQDAQIGCNLACDGGKFDNKKGDALSADGAVIGGYVFLRNGFTAKGTVRLLGAKIGGDIDCLGAKFDDKVALLADGMVVKGAFLFQNLDSPANGVSLLSSHVGHLADDKDSWGNGLVLDGFTYGSITGDAPTDATARLAWLDKQRKEHAGLNGEGADFKPQPWRQLAKVLREMGHAEDARQVTIDFEHRLRKANLIGQPPKHWNKWRSRLYRNVCRTGHWLFRVFTGYGYRPLRLLAWMFGVWLVCAGFYWHAALIGVFAPSSPLVFQNPEYAACRPDYVAQTYLPASAVQPTIQGAGNWYLCEKLREEYSGFSPLAYSLDVLLPLVDLQQETSWAPLIPTPNKNVLQELFAICDWKHVTRLVLWFEILFGWLSSLLLVAVVSGLTKRREE